MVRSQSPNGPVCLEMRPLFDRNQSNRPNSGPLTPALLVIENSGLISLALVLRLGADVLDCGLVRLLRRGAVTRIGRRPLPE